MNQSYCFSGTASPMTSCCSNPQAFNGGYKCIFDGPAGVLDCQYEVGNATGSDAGIACTSNRATSRATARHRGRIPLLLCLLLFSQLIANVASAAVRSPYDGQLLFEDSGVHLRAVSGHVGFSLLAGDDKPLARRDLNKRDHKCSGFRIDSQQDTYSGSKPLSAIINCQNSPLPCFISEGIQHIVTIESDFSLSTGDKVSGINVGKIFGASYTDTVATTIQNPISLPINQEGYLSAYTIATLFKGNFTGCSGGDQVGEALVLKEGVPLYGFVLTNA